MRKGKVFNGENADLVVDYSDNFAEIFEDLNLLLKKRFGIEVITHETNADYHAFSIQQVKKRK